MARTPRHSGCAIRCGGAVKCSLTTFSKVNMTSHPTAAEAVSFEWDKRSSKDGAAQRVTKDLVYKLSENLFTHLANEIELLGVFGTRLQERWLYGYVARSLGNIISSDDCLVTEAPISRNGKNGRVDFLLSYRKWLFLVEMKAMGCSATKDVSSGSRFQSNWNNKLKVEAGAVSQLINLREEDSARIRAIAEMRGLKGVVCLPILLCSYTMLGASYAGLEKRSWPDLEQIRKQHDLVRSALGTTELAAFCLSRTKPFIQAGKGTQWRATAGYSIFAGDKNLTMAS